MNELSADEARRNWRDMLDRVHGGERIGITRNGRPWAVIVSREWHDTVIDYIDATTFTGEAVAFYARQRESGNAVISGEQQR